MPSKSDQVKVRLGYPYPIGADKPKHQPGETVSVPSAEARQLVRDGFARLADTTPTTEKES